MPQRTMRCPICSKEVSVEDPEMPFCSARCRLIDLGNWASDKYSIPGSSIQPGELPEENDATGPEASER
jgi:endogenous inhibitor of DNA gyrase (YacG/DUF329 family)